MLTDIALQNKLGLNSNEFSILMQKEYVHLIAKRPMHSVFENRFTLKTHPWGECLETHRSIRRRIINNTVDSDLQYVTGRGILQFYNLGDSYIYHFTPDQDHVKSMEEMLGYVGNLGKDYKLYGNVPHVTSLFNEIMTGNVGWSVWKNSDTGNLQHEDPTFHTLSEFFKKDLELGTLNNEQLKIVIQQSTSFIKQACDLIK